jgi:hypothetical protein
VLTKSLTFPHLQHEEPTRRTRRSCSVKIADDMPTCASIVPAHGLMSSLGVGERIRGKFTTYQWSGGEALATPFIHVASFPLCLLERISSVAVRR